MRIEHIEQLLHVGSFAESREWQTIRDQIHLAAKSVDWPDGTGTFSIYPESGKKRGEGNGVKPIKNRMMEFLKGEGWSLEEPLDIATVKRPGNLDAVLYTDSGPFAVEWETGNISSSHRALNKMCLGMLHGTLIGGVLIVPTRKLYRFLTDRIGNWDELVPYLDLWKSIPVDEGVLEVVVIEHDEESFDVPRIPKGTDGRATR